jgi:hypothetical protein
VLAATAVYYPLRGFVVARWVIGVGLVALMLGRVIRTRTIF